MTATIPFSPFKRQPTFCESNGAPSTTYVGKTKVRRGAVMVAASSIIAMRCWYGRSSVAPPPQTKIRHVARMATHAPRTSSRAPHPYQMATLALGLVLLIGRGQQPFPALLWNASPSVPLGLYWVARRAPALGDLAIIRLPEPYRSLADSRDYIPAHIFLMKSVVAGVGDVVCRFGPIVILRPRPIAYAKPNDSSGRPLPRWRGCRRLRPNDIFVLSPDPDAFDSRYFGPVRRTNVVGTALAVFPAAAR
jgi:conjugative transfer signal peptidase TraF